MKDTALQSLHVFSVAGLLIALIIFLTLPSTLLFTPHGQARASNPATAETAASLMAFVCIALLIFLLIGLASFFAPSLIPQSLHGLLLLAVIVLIIAMMCAVGSYCIYT